MIMRKFRVYNPSLIDSEMKTIEGINIKEGEKFVEIEAEQVGDQYHTMHELYQHRMALTIALFNYWAKQRYGLELFYDMDTIAKIDGMTVPPIVMKSKLHHDGTMFEGGYFIVMAITTHGQISYHYDLKHWNKFKIPEVERTPEWDGHGSLEVMQRLEMI